jgi:glycosyltransferase involved in cell wall biosynthesis
MESLAPRPVDSCPWAPVAVTAAPATDPPIVVVIPALNEERFIGSVVLQARLYADRVVVVDDGSTDATAEVARAAGAEIVSHPCNRGKGAALNTGFAHVRRLAPRAVAVLDADGQHRPGEIRPVLAPVLAGEADIVVGSRYLGSGHHVPAARVWGHRFFTGLTNRLSGTRVTDSQNGFRAFSSAAIEAITFSSRGFSVESEMQFLARAHGLRLVEMPVTTLYQDRPKRSLLTHGLLVVGGVMRLFGRYRPLFLFGGAGLGLLVAAAGWGVVAWRCDELGLPAAMPTVLTGSLAALGLLLLSAGITLHALRSLLVELLRLAPGRPGEGRG